MSLKIDAISETAISIHIEKEDYSIADVIHRELLNVKHVKFAGVPPPHPLIKALTIQVHTDGAKPSKVVLEAIDLSQQKASELLGISRRIFPATTVSANSDTSPANHGVGTNTPQSGN